MKQAKELYERGENIMRLFREAESSEVNSLNGILAAYDLQAGSYVRLLSDPIHARFAQAYCAAIASILDRLSPVSVMEAGVGEATTLVNTLHQMRHRPPHALGFDISWSRVAVGREFAEANHANGAVHRQIIEENRNLFSPTGAARQLLEIEELGTCGVSPSFSVPVPSTSVLHLALL